MRFPSPCTLFHIPRHAGVIRASGETHVISVKTIAAPPIAREPCGQGENHSARRPGMGRHRRDDHRFFSDSSRTLNGVNIENAVIEPLRAANQFSTFSTYPESRSFSFRGRCAGFLSTNCRWCSGRGERSVPPARTIHRFRAALCNFSASISRSS